MRFLIDECIKHQLADELSKLGHDAVSVHSLGLSQKGYPDAELLQIACSQERIMVTLDYDLTDLFSQLPTRVQKSGGVIWIRCTHARLRVIKELLLNTLSRYPPDFFIGHIVRISPNEIKQI